MNLRHLKIFVTVCDCGSITAAANKLFVSQPSVSAAIREIETEFQVKLFDRISKKLYLSEAGKQLLEQARYLISQYDSLEAGLRNWEMEGILRIGSSITIGNRFLPASVANFKKTHGKIRVKVAINSSEKIESMILDNELDLALIEGEPHHKNLVSSVFLQDELLIICAVNHPLANGGQITLEQLADSDMLLREKGSGTRELFDHTMALQNINVEPVWESVSTQALIRAVETGLGLSVLPYWLVQDALSSHTVSSLRIPGIRFQRNYHIIHHCDKYISAPMRDFIEICRQGEHK